MSKGGIIEKCNQCGRKVFVLPGRGLYDDSECMKLHPCTPWYLVNNPSKGIPEEGPVMPENMALPFAIITILGLNIISLALFVTVIGMLRSCW